MNVVIVGGGFAGVKTALELACVDGFKVTLINSGADFEYHGALYRSTIDHSLLEVVLNLEDMFVKFKNIEVKIDKALAINAVSKYVSCESGNKYSYDKLIMCLGNEKNNFVVPGVNTYAHSVYSIRNTVNLRNELVNLFTIPHKQKVRIIVIGAGQSGVEISGELQKFANSVAEKYNHVPKKVEVDLIEKSDKVVPRLKTEASRVALKRLKRIGVNVILGKEVVRCSRNSVQFADGERAADIIIWTAGSMPADIFSQYPDIFDFENGKVAVNEYLQSPKSRDVYVLGDSTNTRYSGMAQTAIFDAMFVSNNLKLQASGKGPKTYIPKIPVYVVPIAGKWAITQIGDKVRSGSVGWMKRKKADRYISKNFEPMKKLIR